MPDKITITSGPVDGMYHQHAQKYAAFFHRHGLAAEIVTSAGSGQNIERLRNTDTPNQIGFVQGGFGAIDRVLTSETRASIQTLANVDIEPVWIFSRNKHLDSLLQLQGQRVSIGRIGSGSRVVALKLLEQMRMEPKDMLTSDTTGLEAVNALVQDQLDAAIFVAAPTAPVVKAMLRASGVHLAQLKQTAAFTERIAYLEPKLVAQGMLDRSASQPKQDTILLTTVASLVANENLHPALKRLATAAAMEVHQGATPLSKAGDFPNLKHVDFPLAP
ncbi:MAG: TAXI family TRAP transporter solute-binding subunit, partial [Burkholderiaceae bacterium]